MSTDLVTSEAEFDLYDLDLSLKKPKSSKQPVKPRALPMSAHSSKKNNQVM
ncbi:hypothetical protein R6Q59_016239 [Mikania micrantha]